MKRIIYFLIIALAFSSCMSSKKMMNKGYYDRAIAKSVKKLKKNPQNGKEIAVLKDAYRLANQKDNENISFLRKEGRPDIWDEVFSTVSILKNRQDIIRTLPTDVLSKIGYQYIDYDQELISAKQKAAEYFYVHAVSLIDKKEKMAARQAYDELIRVKGYYPSYKDVDQKLLLAKEQGMSYVIFVMKNVTSVPLPPDFESELTKISLYELNNFWTNFDTREVKNRVYDYAIMVNMKNINVSPEQAKEIERTETKKVEDGYQYVLDAKGNVMKDSLGNDIKIQKYKDIQCFVTEHKLHKQSIISGSIDFMKLSNGQLMKSDPITSEYFFDYSWAIAKGDMNAASEETKKMIKNKAIPFPDSFGMLLNTGQILKNMTKDIIWSNKNMFY
ncbi:MAG: hypothetical protein WCK02_12945 [Bacteroidota bacterium]